MKYRYLGNSGLAVSQICLGTSTFGEREWGCDENTALEILNAFIEQGGNFIDTADKYAGTLSEQIIGRWLADRNRDDLVVATKCFFPTSDNINSRGLSRKHIISACEASLKRLQTDYIDLYQAHESDPQTPVEETMAALDTLVRQGKVRYIGCSNWPAWKVMQASYITRDRASTPFISGQYLYNLLKRDIEAEVVPACKESGMGIVCWSPLSGGMLTGKYKNAEMPPEGSRLATRIDLVQDRYAQWVKKSAMVVEKVSEIAMHHNVTPAVVSLAWLLKCEQVASVSVGAKRAEQVAENCKVSEWRMPEDEWDSLRQISLVGFGYPTDQCKAIEFAKA
jgi:aryl-alcohol dehydrogenase-like predicted oxidoreductase